MDPEEDVQEQDAKTVRRGPGRPRGSPDFRPFIVGLVQRRHKTIAGALMRLQDLMAKLTPEKQLDCELRLLELGLRGSPKTVVQEEASQFKLVLEGMPPKAIPPRNREGNQVPQQDEERGSTSFDCGLWEVARAAHRPAPPNPEDR